MCGNRCDLCLLYRDNFKGEEIAAVNDALYRYHHGAEGPRPHYDLPCDGCLSNGHIAREGCAIRACVVEKRFATCASCPQMYCQLLESDMAVIEGALSKHGATIPTADFERFFRPYLIREALAKLRQAHAS
jgi:hypothetical protein